MVKGGGAGHGAGASLYQTADLGLAPYDYLSLGLRDYTPCPYFGCRIFTDALSAL